MDSFGEFVREGKKLCGRTPKDPQVGLADQAGIVCKDLWPTPQAHDYATPKTPEQIAAMLARAKPRKAGGKPGFSNLNEIVGPWQDSLPGPPGPLTTTAGGPSCGTGPTLPRLWPTPMEHDHWMSNNPRTDGRQEQLPNVAARFCDHPRRRLNPAFVEWLMGWSIGWTAFGPLGTESYQSWLDTHSSLLCGLLKR